jgi:hypothetical protein
VADQTAEIREDVTRYEVCAMPAGAMDADQFVIKVELYSDGLWSVSHRGAFLGADGCFYAWVAAKFPVEEALRLARELAPVVRIGGMTAAEYQVWARERVVGRG